MFHPIKNSEVKNRWPQLEKIITTGAPSFDFHFAEDTSERIVIVRIQAPDGNSAVLKFDAPQQASNTLPDQLDIGDQACIAADILLAIYRGS